VSLHDGATTSNFSLSNLLFLESIMQSNLMIKDLPIADEMDSKAMSAVRGGSAISIVGGNSQSVVGGGGFASPTTSAQVGPTVNTLDASSHLNLSLPTAQNFGGVQGLVL
jgi:hypothetical protein